MKKETYVIDKMDCAVEEQLIRKRLKNEAGVESLDFDLMSRKLTVEHSLDSDKTILGALKDIGMEPSTPTEDGDSQPPSKMGQHVMLGLAGACAVAAEAISLLTGKEKSIPIIALAIIAILLAGPPVLKKGWIALKTFSLNINFLMSIATVGALAIGAYPEAAMVIFLFGVAEMIEAYALDRARKAIQTLVEIAPQEATVRQADGSWTVQKVEAIAMDAMVRVKPGERIALDGIVVSGQSTVNQAPITGESMPVSKTVGDTLFAGTINEEGVLEFKVTGSRGNTTLDHIIKTVQEAQGRRAPTQRFVDSFAKIYTPVIVILAVLVATVPLAFGQPFMPWLYKALVMLVIACPCALVISTPVTVVSGLAAAAKRGILIKGGAYLEDGRRLKAIAVDKTGTLTEGKPEVTDVIPMNGFEKEKALLISASLDTLSQHPVAQAIVKAFDGQVLNVADFQSVSGRGVSGTIDGQAYILGNHRFAHESGICKPEVEAELAKLEADGKTTVVLGNKEQVLAIFGVADTLRETSVEAIKSLHDLGIRAIMLTGDNAATAKAIASRSAIDDVRADLLPEDKLTAIEELLKEHGSVGMLGDGVNDAPALARASIGFAMGAAGTDTAIETADVALMDDDLRKLPEFVELSRKTSSILVQNITVAIGFKVVFFALALVGIATLWMAVIADVGASLLVVGNGLRMLVKPKDEV
ncbi:MAG: heavy metal translocating P-type ATPase [Armatimonadetes bacterium]|nr:heavy metal translocating P-type ATPase [Armatimonadota bacterium]